MKFLLAAPALAVLLVVSPTQAAAQSAVEGTWVMTIQSPEGPSEFPIQIVQEGDALTVSAPPGPDAQFTFEGSVDGSNVRFEMEVDYQGTPLPITLTGSTSEASMDGIADFGGMAQGTWSAERSED